MTIHKPCHHPITPPNYPFTGRVDDSYTYCACGNQIPKPPHVMPPHAQFPSHGPFQGSMFTANNTIPYLVDSTFTSYGQVLCYSEHVYTQITQRRDPSCLNLAATFNLTDTTMPNGVRMDFLKKYISRKYAALQGVLPIIKTPIKLKVYYTITDSMGGVLLSAHSTTTVLDNCFHFTDIPDSFVQSIKGVIIENIPAMTYQGLYTLTIDRVEAYVSVINTLAHMADGVNPFYAFIENNQKIRLNYSVIESTPPDQEILIAEADINKSFDYSANITNRLRISFTAYTNMPIVSGNTCSIYESLMEPTGEIIEQLRNELTAVEDEIKVLHEIIEQQNILIQNLNGQITLNKNNIAELTTRVTALETNSNDVADTLNDHERRILILEAIPLATWSYHAGNEFQRAQITWKSYGQLYQVTRSYTASGNFEQDIADGYLVPITTNASDLAAITERLSEVETTANSANDIATSTQSTVEGFASSITDNANAIQTVTQKADKNESDILSMTGTIDDLSVSVNVMEADIQTIKDDIEDIKEVLPINPDNP